MRVYSKKIYTTIPGGISGTTRRSRIGPQLLLERFDDFLQDRLFLLKPLPELYLFGIYDLHPQIREIAFQDLPKRRGFGFCKHKLYSIHSFNHPYGRAVVHVIPDSFIGSRDFRESEKPGEDPTANFEEVITRSETGTCPGIIQKLKSLAVCSGRRWKSRVLTAI
jgi:hypothetical protein